MEPETRKLLLSEELSGFLQLETNVSKSDYEAYINEDDLKIYANVDKFVENGEPYYLEYRIRIGEKEVLISDKARPYISKDGIIKFYIGVIGKLGNEVLLSDEETGIILKEEDFQKHFAELSEKTHDLEFRCTFAKFILEDKDLKGSIYERVINYIYGIIKEHFSDKTFLLNDGGFISVLEINDQRVIDRKIKTILGIADKGIIYENTVVHFDLKAAVVRFPRDTYNFQEIEEFLEISLNTPNRYQIFNDDIHKHYLKKKAINACVLEQLKFETLELLYLKLITRDNYPAFEVGYNIPGLNPKEEISEYLDLKIKVPLEKLVFKSLLKAIDVKREGRFYLHISCATLDLLLKDDFFTKNNIEKYRKIVLCIDDCSPHFEKILSGLSVYEFKINVNYENLEKINLGTLIKYKLNGTFINNELENRSKALAVLAALDYEILVNVVYSDYYNVVIRTDEIIKAEQIR